MIHLKVSYQKLLITVIITGLHVTTYKYVCVIVFSLFSVFAFMYSQLAQSVCFCCCSCCFIWWAYAETDVLFVGSQSICISSRCFCFVFVVVVFMGTSLHASLIIDLVISHANIIIIVVSYFILSIKQFTAFTSWNIMNTLVWYL